MKANPNTLDWHLTMADLAHDYLTERITDAEYVRRATAMGLTAQQAVDRCLAHDMARYRGRSLRSQSFSGETDDF